MPEHPAGRLQFPSGSSPAVTSNLYKPDVLFAGVTCNVALITISGQPNLATIHTFRGAAGSYLTEAESQGRKLVMIVDFSNAELGAVIKLLAGIITIISSQLSRIESSVWLQILIVPTGNPGFTEVVSLFQTENQVRRGKTDVAAGGILVVSTMQEAVTYIENHSSPKPAEG